MLGRRQKLTELSTDMGSFRYPSSDHHMLCMHMAPFSLSNRSYSTFLIEVWHSTTSCASTVTWKECDRTSSWRHSLYFCLNPSYWRHSQRCVLDVQSVRISNDLYGTDVVPLIEFTKGYTRPLSSHSNIQNISKEIFGAQVNFVAMRKLHKILRRHTLMKNPSHPVTWSRRTLSTIRISEDIGHGHV